MGYVWLDSIPSSRWCEWRSKDHFPEDPSLWAWFVLETCLKERKNQVAHDYDKLRFGYRPKGMFYLQENIISRHGTLLMAMILFGGEFGHASYGQS